MKLLAVITARGGSKRLPGKNTRTLGGKPLITWSIDVAKDIPEVCDILVTTDDPLTAKISSDAGALVPWLRPAKLSTDTASSVDVCLHALDWYEGNVAKVDGLILLQPTSPFRNHNTVRRGIELFRKHNHLPILGVSPAKSHPMWCYEVKGESMRPFIEGKGEHLRSQDLPAAFVANGAFYLVSSGDLREHRSFYDDHSVPLVMNGYEECIDIDTEWDWKMAEMVLSLVEVRK